MSDVVPIIENAAQTTFDWDDLIAKTKELLAEDRTLERRQVDITLRRFEIRLQIGMNLLLLQQEHATRGYGDFISTAQKEFGIGTSTIYDHLRVAQRLAPHLHDRANAYSWETARELARPSTSDTIIEQVEIGEIEATPQAIREARKAEQEAKERAEEIRRKAGEQVKEALIQIALFEQQDQSRLSEITSLTSQIEALECQIAALIEQPEQIKEIEKPVIPSEVAEQITQLQSELKEYTEQRERLSNQVQRLSAELEETRDANKARRERELYETRVKQGWQQVTDTFNRSVTTLLTQFPSVFDAQIFDNTDWTRLDHAIEVAQRFMAECEKLRTRPASLIVEAG